MGADSPTMPATIAARAERYRAELDAAYAEHPELPRGVLEAIGDRETLWGWAPEYRLADGTQARGRSDGTGDWEPRWGGRAVVRPGDGLGWSRGLMSIDLVAHPAFCARTCPSVETGEGLLSLRGHTPGPAWACARCNIAYAAGVFAAGLKQADGYLPEAICAYNAGWGAVLRARAGGPGPASVAELDKHTTGGDYVSDVLRRQFDYLREAAQPPASAGKET